MSTLLQGITLENRNGEQQDGAQCVRGKVTAFYFAADWCPNCRDFQPTLNEFYEEVNENEKRFEIVFVGSDATESDQLDHFRKKQEGGWMIPFANPLRNELKRKYNVCAMKEMEEVGITDRKAGIPSLVVVNDQGDILDFNGVESIEQKGPEAINNWL